MATATESIESLHILLAERDATIATIKEKTRAFVEKLKTDHAEALVQEQTSRQQFQVSKSFLFRTVSPLQANYHAIPYTINFHFLTGQVGSRKTYFHWTKRREDCVD